jgi:hypothetical protein
LRFRASQQSATVFASLLAFVSVCLAFVNQVGFEDDEALIASGVYSKTAAVHRVAIFGHNIPVMLINYVGALKSWVYGPIFHFWKPSPASLRAPAILAGSLTIWLFYLLLIRVANRRAAAVGCLLLSTDTVFLLTTCYDWGPVVLQHLLLVSGVLCVVRFHQERQSKYLAIGFFFFGLALWDKALFAWILSGMAISLLVVFPEKAREALCLRNFGLAAFSFCVGAAPLIFYNVRYPLDTFRSNVGYGSENLLEKTQNLASTLNGEALFGYLARLDPEGPRRNPQNAIERFSVWISEATSPVMSGYLGYALIASVVAVPWLWSSPVRRPILFSIVAMLVAWLQMLFARNAGNSAHHVILLWPFPALVVAVALTEVFSKLGPIGKPLLAAVIVFVAGTSALVTNHYFALLVRNGGGLVWTDAIYPLSDRLKGIESKVIYINDWGMIDSLRLLNRVLPLRISFDALSKPHLDIEERREILERISERGAIFVGHTDANEIFKGVNENLRVLASEAGYRRERIAEVADRNGRLIFEVFRFEHQ